MFLGKQPNKSSFHPRDKKLEESAIAEAIAAGDNTLQANLLDRVGGADLQRYASYTTKTTVVGDSPIQLLELRSNTVLWRVVPSSVTDKPLNMLHEGSEGLRRTHFPVYTNAATAIKLAFLSDGQVSERYKIQAITPVLDTLWLNVKDDATATALRDFVHKNIALRDAPHLTAAERQRTRNQRAMLQTWLDRTLDPSISLVEKWIVPNDTQAELRLVLCTIIGSGLAGIAAMGGTSEGDYLMSCALKGETLMLRRPVELRLSLKTSEIVLTRDGQTVRSWNATTAWGISTERLASAEHYDYDRRKKSDRWHFAM